jgi:hypothetical protein|tara:strand:- start:191 stop:313 length:123 start_codon:yes stop_codon:yes gene_type:complete
MIPVSFLVKILFAFAAIVILIVVVDFRMNRRVEKGDKKKK